MGSRCVWPSTPRSRPSDEVKVVINKCYGGYSLSRLALVRLQELRGEPCHFMQDKNYRLRHARSRIGKPKLPPLWWEVTLKEVEAQKCSDIEVVPCRDPKIGPWEEGNYIDHRPDNRNDPLLVQVVEELGDKANGECAKLRVVDIPDGVSYEIHDYDGIESIEEVHRSWG